MMRHDYGHNILSLPNSSNSFSAAASAILTITSCTFCVVPSKKMSPPGLDSKKKKKRLNCNTKHTKSIQINFKLFDPVVGYI